MQLIIVESPTKARTLTRFLSRDFRIESTMGHIRDLPQKKLGVKTAQDFAPTYVIIPGKKKVIDQLKNAARKADKIFLATDPDREGEAIAYHVAVVCSNQKPKTKNQKHILKIEKEKAPDTFDTLGTFQRIVFHEITSSAVKHALENPRAIDMHLVSAQTARRILDRLVGYKLSPLLWYKVRKGLSAGRVQSVAVRLIVEREREIEKFVPVEYWLIDAELKKYLGSEMADAPSFLARLIKKNGEKFEVPDKTVAEEIVAELKNCGYEVGNIEKKEVRRWPAPPFITSTLQQRAANLFGWPAKKTMRVAQKLYEQGLITYHRTDSTNLAVEAVQSCRGYINKVYGDKYLPEEPRIYKTKSKVAQEAHEAIRPTDISRITYHVSPDDEAKLYRLIWKRFVACQMNPAVVEETEVEVLATARENHYLLEARGEVEIFDGWRKVWVQDQRQSAFRSASDQRQTEQEQLPPLTKGDELRLIKLLPTQKFTQPPPRYNEASLIKELEKLGIGRPSTYAPIISTIQDRQYVEKEEKKFRPTNLGIAVNDFLLEYFAEILDYQFTAKMEDNLDKIANGEQEWMPVIREFYIPFNTKLISVSRVAERVKPEVETTGETCPECGQGSVVVRIGRFGKFLSCSRFPDCKWKANWREKTGQACPKCGGEVIIKKTKKGKSFYGCANYPKCNWASWKKPG